MAEELAAAGRRIVAELAGPDRLVLAGVGWATVELARAERELSGALGPALAAGFGPAADDVIMGAYSRLARLDSGLALVILEPNTEGRLAGCLARWGETIVVAYVTEPAGRSEWRDTRSPEHDSLPLLAGPLGPARHLAGGRRGPHLVLVGHGPPGDRR